MYLSCDKNSKCNNCGDIVGGLVTMKVNETDLTKYEGLAQLNGVSLGTCIQAYIYQQELVISSVKVLDECCCEL